MKELQARKKVSIDEERNMGSFSIQGYQNDFVCNNETSNNISSVLSAMISQIESSPEQKDYQNSYIGARGTSVGYDDNASTVEESNLDDLFDNFSSNVKCDLKLNEREPDEVKEVSKSLSLTAKHNDKLTLHEECDKTLEV